jgi:hypothetical protein
MDGCLQTGFKYKSSKNRRSVDKWKRRTYATQTKKIKIKTNDEWSKLKDKVTKMA